MFKPAERTQSRLRMAIDGPSGSGKSLTALRCAMALGQRIAVIDTERGSASKYAGDEWDGRKLDFQVCELKTFSPSEYTFAIDYAGKMGADVLVIDSLSHAWEGKDGALDLVDKASGSNKWAAWKDVTPLHRTMIDAILQAPCHVIVTMRTKTEWVTEKDERGRNVPRKIGLAPIQRPGMEYEFDIYGSMDLEHVLTISKTRCSAIDKAVVVKPGAAFMQPVLEWLGRGRPAELSTKAAEPPPAKPPAPEFITPEQVAQLTDLLRDAGADVKAFLAHYAVVPAVLPKFPAVHFQDAVDKLQKKIARKINGQPAVAPIQQVARIMALLEELKITSDTASKQIKDKYGTDSLASLTEAQADELESVLEKMRQKKKPAA